MANAKNDSRVFEDYIFCQFTFIIILIFREHVECIPCIPLLWFQTSHMGILKSVMVSNIGFIFSLVSQRDFILFITNDNLGTKTRSLSVPSIVFT